jgi:tRNA modification GTPase
MSDFDTIAAIATPVGEAGLAVIRVSGTRAIAVADGCFRAANGAAVSAAASHTIQYGHIEQDGRRIDEVMVAVMRAPRTFTKEDVIEITCHGGILTTRLVLEAALASGARSAEPGEFTKRAFLNGRLDLAQAEAVADLIHSRTELALDAANEQLAGKLSRRIEELREELLKTLAHVEAHIDFPDEDIAPETMAGLIARLEDGAAFMDELLKTAREGQILRRGIRAAIVGRPNAGKSSLLNHLLGHERAIVSTIAGTTRDTIEETANIRGIPVIFVDTAGLREASNEIEQEGIRRSHDAWQRAELILHIVDNSEALTEEDTRHLEQFAGDRRLLIRNKCDLETKLILPAPRDREAVSVSCVDGNGIEALKDALKARVWSGDISSENLQIMINSRHQDALRRARAATDKTIEALRQNLTLELAAMDLHIAVNAVGEIVGKTSTEDLLDKVFSQFCIGK